MRLFLKLTHYFHPSRLSDKQRWMILSGASRAFGSINIFDNDKQIDKESNKHGFMEEDGSRSISLRSLCESSAGSTRRESHRTDRHPTRRSRHPDQSEEP